MSKTVLVVDDDRLNTTLVKFALKEARYSVVTAIDGREALEAVRNARPDLIILDIQMPQMSGFEFMNELKSLPSGGDIPVIMLTANENMQDIFFSEGVKGYFVKPVDTVALLSKVKAVVGAAPLP